MDGLGVGLPADVVEKARAFLATGGEDALLALLAEVRASTVEGLLASVETLARQAAREEAFVLLADHRCLGPAAARAEAQASSTRLRAVAPAPEGSLGASLAANERERRALIDKAILDVLMRGVGDVRAPQLLSTEIARAIEQEGARLAHVDVVDGLLRLVRARRVSTDAGFYWLRETPAEEARA